MPKTLGAFYIENLDVTGAQGYNLSIRLRSDGLTFNIFDATSLQLLLSDTVVNRHNDNTITSVIEDVFYNNAWLSFPFSKVEVIYEPINWILVPFDLYEEEKGEIWLRSITEYNNLQKDRCLRVLNHSIHKDGKVLLCDIYQELFEFLSRNLVINNIKPYFFEDLDYARELSKNHYCKVLQIFVTSTAIDCVIVDKGVVFRGNHFNFTNSSDNESHRDELVYFAINIYNAAGLSNSKDRIIVMQSVYDDIDTDAVVSILKPYTSSVDIVKKDDYENNIGEI